MITLDEVIEIASDWTNGFDEMSIEKQMLHYLKEYRETKKHLACLDDAEIRGDNTQVVNNPPLTWDELKTMEGKPVWIEADNGQEQFKHWFIIDEFTFSDIPGLQIMWCLNNSFRFWEADIGKTWQAYRKEKRS